MESVWIRSITEVDGEMFPVQTWVPRRPTPADGWPVLLSLHGAGERGSDGLRQIEVGLGPVLSQHPDWFPSVVVCPQAPEGSWWKGRAARAALQAIHQLPFNLPTDNTRMYAAGLSMGGYGVLDLILREPNLFAAAVCVCGGLIAPSVFPGMSADLALDIPYDLAAGRMVDTALWLFHGEHDPVIPVTESRLLKAAGDRLGHRIRYTEFANGGHNAWDQAYSETELWQWLFDQRQRRDDFRSVTPSMTVVSPNS